MFVNDEWVIGTPNEDELEMMDSELDIKQVRRKAERIAVVAFYVTAFPGCFMWWVMLALTSSSNAWWTIMSIWIGMICLFAFVEGSVLRLGKKDVAEANALRQTYRFFSEDDPAFEKLLKKAGRNLLMRHKHTVDEFLSNPCIWVPQDLMDMTDDANRDEADVKLNAIINRFVKRLRQLDKPHRDNMRRLREEKAARKQDERDKHQASQDAVGEIITLHLDLYDEH